MKYSLDKIVIISLSVSLLVVIIFIIQEINFTNRLVLKSDLITHQGYLGIGRIKDDNVYAWVDLPTVYDRVIINDQVIELPAVTHHEFALKKAGDKSEVHLIFEKDNLNFKKYIRQWLPSTPRY